MQKTDKQTRAQEESIIRDLLNLNPEIEITFNDIGWTSRVYVINDGETVFKFPRSEKIKEEYRFEIPAYKIAHQIGGVLIPEVVWEHPNTDYMGYRGIVGKSLDQVVKSLSGDEKTKIGAALGIFLKKLHQQELENAPTMSPEKEFAEYQHKLELGLSDIQKYFTEEEVAAITSLVCEQYPARMTELGFNKGLCHGDLGYWNMVYSSTKQIGIIDFGDVGYYDTSIDFAGMTDKEMLDAALVAYGNTIDREKIELRMKIIPVLDLPFFIGKEDREGIERTVKRIREVSLT